MTVGCGAGLIVVWWGVAGRGVFADQVGWLTAGIAVLMVSLYVLASVVIRGRRAVGDRRARLISDGLLDLVPLLADRSEALDDLASEGLPVSDVVVLAGVGMFHEAGCPMVAGRKVIVMSRSEAVGGGLEGCGICDQVATAASPGGGWGE
jgi:hypothetical protein